MNQTPESHEAGRIVPPVYQTVGLPDIFTELHAHVYGVEENAFLLRLLERYECDEDEENLVLSVRERTIEAIRDDIEDIMRNYGRLCRMFPEASSHVPGYLDVRAE